MASGEKQGGAMENGEKWTVIVNAVIPHYFIPLTDSAVQGKTLYSLQNEIVPVLRSAGTCTRTSTGKTKLVMTQSSLFI